MSNQRPLKPGGSLTCFLCIRAALIVSLGVTVVRLDSSLLKEDSEGWEGWELFVLTFVIPWYRAKRKSPLSVCDSQEPAWLGQLDSKIERSLGKMTLGVQRQGCWVSHLSSCRNSLLQFFLSVSGVGFSRGFLSLSGLHVPWGHDLGLMVWSQLTSVGRFLCFRQVPYVIESSWQPAEVVSERWRNFPLVTGLVVTLKITL